MIAIPDQDTNIGKFSMSFHTILISLLHWGQIKKVRLGAKDIV